YVAEMKGVLATLAPGVPIVDLSHDIAPQDVEGGRLALARCWRRFPEGTVHLAVVDPGVGSGRAALAVECDGRFQVGPDNGLLSPALLRGDARVVALPVPPGAAPTFHGRDLFAPAAAALAMGSPLASLGEPHSDPVLRRTPEARRLADGAIEGVVMTIDRFGNAITNLLGARGGVVEVNGASLPVRRTYAEGGEGEAIALVGSSGFVEIAVRDGSAAAGLGLLRGDRVLLRH
ncbi:MAG TPA: SAM-dependent chlorinase/fluorinase, partial [Gemmatimonadaceae bacterium]